MCVVIVAMPSRNRHAGVPMRDTAPPRVSLVLEEIDKGKLVTWAALGLLVVALVLRLHSHGSAASPSVSLEAPARAGPAAATARAPAARELYVDVAGAVLHPGLYRVPAGARVAVAVDRAGGLSRRGDPAGVNLAAPLQDGQQVVVPARGATPAAGAGSATSGATSGASGTSGSSGPISLSQATESQLEQIDGIGPALAGRIIQYREAHGGFHSLDELREVSGIGDKRFETLSRALRP
jgi:competence protein ComEA